MIIGQMATHFVAVDHLLCEQPRLYKWYGLALNKENMGNHELFSGLMIAPFDVSPGHHINRLKISPVIVILKEKRIAGWVPFISPGTLCTSSWVTTTGRGGRILAFTGSIRSSIG
jgi:hypothetical protein